MLCDCRVWLAILWRPRIYHSKRDLSSLPGILGVPRAPLHQLTTGIGSLSNLIKSAKYFWGGAVFHNNYFRTILRDEKLDSL